MVSVKINGAAAAVAVLLLSALIPCHAHASTDEPAAYNHHLVPAASPPSYSPPAPTPAPVQPVVIVQGVIYCKSCNLTGYNRGLDASPLPKATAKLVCYGDESSNYTVMNMTSTTTDKNGYFLVMVYDVDMFDRHSCRLYLGSSPTKLCAAPYVPSNMALGLTLVRDTKAQSLPRGVHVFRPRGVLMYAPRSGGKCPPY